MEAVYQKFKGFVHEQRTAVVENNMVALGNILPQMEKITEQIFFKNDNRIAFMEMLSERHGEPIANIKQLQGAFPKEDYSKLLPIMEELKQLRIDIEENVQINATLINAAHAKNQLFMETVLKVPASVKAKSNKTYNAKGSTALRSSEHVSLINRRG